MSNQSDDKAERKHDGGPAFPREDYQAADAPGQRGMSLRDYFMAHAPAEPQAWFMPVMPEMPSSAPLPKPPKKWMPCEAEEVRQWIAGEVKAEDLKSDRSRKHALEVEAHERLTELLDAFWKQEREKQRYIQWPAAWADEMLKQRRPAD